MAFVNHVNLENEDGKVYCKKTDSVVVLDESHSTNHCSKCPMFAGSAQGNGVECYYNDKRSDLGPVIKVSDPYVEKDQQNLADILFDGQEQKLVVKD